VYSALPTGCHWAKSAVENKAQFHSFFHVKNIAVIITKKPFKKTNKKAGYTCL